MYRKPLRPLIQSTVALTLTLTLTLWSGIAASPAWAAEPVRRADFAKLKPSDAARHIADWVVDSADNRGMPFVIVDKARARVIVFDASGRAQGDSPALLGAAKGDDSVPGIGNRPLSTISFAERTTPAGRFVAERGQNAAGEDIIWVDYDAAVSMHRVRTTKASERRLQRLATPAVGDNRISYGCINLPVSFYNKVLDRHFKGSHGVVYVLPETRPLTAVFKSYDVDARARDEVARLGLRD